MRTKRGVYIYLLDKNFIKIEDIIKKLLIRSTCNGGFKLLYSILYTNFVTPNTSRILHIIICKKNKKKNIKKKIKKKIKKVLI